MSDSNKILPNDNIVEDITRNMEKELNIQNGLSQCHLQSSPNNEDSAIPKDFDESDSEENITSVPDDFIDEMALKDSEVSLSESELEERHKEALSLKKIGNEQYNGRRYLESIITYTNALRLCPLKYEIDRAVLYANRAASKTLLDRNKSAIEDCSKAIELHDKYVKAYLRRAKLYEQSEQLDECLEDYKKVLELDPRNKDAQEAQIRLPPLINERNEKLKTEMFTKLKDLGNMVLRPFGLSTDNFQLQQDANTGGYSINFKQNTD